MALTNKLTAIADAIRAKDGSTDLLTLDQMPTAIAAIETGGGGDLPEEAFTISGNCSHRFRNDGWNWFIENYGNKITTENIINIEGIFEDCLTLEEIPFTININNTSIAPCTFKNAFTDCRLVPKITLNISDSTIFGDMDYMFGYCYALKEVNDITFSSTTYKNLTSMFASCQSIEQLPYIYNAYPANMANIFSNCYSLKAIPADYFDTWDFSRINSYTYATVNNMFQSCYSLRSIPAKVLSYFCNETVVKSNYNNFYCKTFNQCYALDEIIDFPVVSVALTSNMFSDTFLACGRVKNITFKTNEDGSAKTAKWKNQIVDLATDAVGFIVSNNVKNLLNYSDITEDKKVTDDATYQALKNDADWFTSLATYSRYNHDSAVNTINSLPDTSAYGTNTIKFRGSCGSSTDGGAINTLTEEEIAVATAKGWTVTLN